MGFKIGKTKAKIYTCQPKDKDELKEILKSRLSKKDKNTDLNDIDVSQITDMSGLFLVGTPGSFSRLGVGKIDISNWDVSNVKNMDWAFSFCKNFNSDLSEWDMSNVTSAEGMFMGCIKFEGNGLENWDVSNIKNMKQMFDRCSKLKCDLSKWNISNNCEVKDMFSGNKKRDNIILPKGLYDSTSRKTHKSNGDELMWYTVWKILDKNGPMSKAEVLTKMGLKPTSYATSFASWSSHNIIRSVGGKLEAVPQNQWTKEIF